MIKAIETRYAGCHFRSRLEARYAVLFDSLGVEWQYEKEGFDLPSGPYLPDFYLPGVVDGSWFEVKPVRQKQDPRWGDLVRVTQKSLYIGYDIKRPGDHIRWDGIHLNTADFESPELEDFWGSPMFCRCDAPPGKFWVIDGCKDNHRADRIAFYKAVGDARSARFEHGHSGRS